MCSLALYIIIELLRVTATGMPNEYIMINADMMNTKLIASNWMFSIFPVKFSMAFKFLFFKNRIWSSDRRGLLYYNIEYDQLVLSYSLRLHDNFVNILNGGEGKETIFLETENKGSIIHLHPL